MSWTFERVAGPYAFTEGPVWHGGGILFSDIPNRRIMRYDVDTGNSSVYRENTGCANGLKMDPEGTLYACEMTGRQLVRYDGDETITIVDEFEGARFNSPNDLAIDADGTIWFTDPYYATSWESPDKVLELDHRSVYRVDPNDPSTLTRVTFDTTNPNGLLVAPDGDRLYVAQSDHDAKSELRAYSIQSDATLGEFEVLHNFAPHRAIDGMCLDAEGNIVATAGYEDGGPGPIVYVFEPTGRILETHPTPDPRPTNCCFGGENLSTLYLTGNSGSLFRAETDRVGYLGPPDA